VTGIIPNEAIKWFGEFVFLFALSALLFNQMYSIDIHDLDWSFVGSVAAGSILGSKIISKFTFNI
jgi:hypothetical protein